MIRIGEDDIAGAKRWKYNSQCNTIFMKLFYTSFWEWLATWLPSWLAPNVITLVGFIAQFLSFVLSCVMSEWLTKPIAPWVCGLNFVGSFIYTTLDALDGKQARRTKSGSVLGHFFDHGCDALTTVFELVKLAAALDAGAGTGTFLLIFITSVGFYMASYQEYVTDRFWLADINGTVEGVTAVQFMYLSVAFWPASAKLYANRWGFMIFFIGSLVSALIPAFWQIICDPVMLEAGRWKKFWYGLLAACVTVALVLAHVPRHVGSVSFLLGANLVLPYQAQLSVVYQICGRSPEYLLFDSCTVVIWLMLAVAFFIDVPTWWHIFAGAVLAIIVCFDISVVKGLSKGLGIPVFTMPKRVAPEAAVATPESATNTDVSAVTVEKAPA